MVLAEDAFLVDGLAVRWLDVIVAAARWGDWRAHEERVRHGLACARRASAEGSPLPSGTVEARAKEFRYDRDLETADSMEQWLQRVGLTAEQWSATLKRIALREHWKNELPETLAKYPVSDEDVRASALADALCDGTLKRLARKLAGRLAARAALTNGNGDVSATGPMGDEGERRSIAQQFGVSVDDVAAAQSRIEGTDAVVDRFRADRVQPRAVREYIGARTLDWMRFRCRVLAFPTEDMAQEALLGLRDDGESPTGIYVAAKLPPVEKTFRLDEMEADARDHFLGAQPGDLVGPVKSNGGYAVYLVEQKTLPTENDPELTKLAADGVLRGAIRQEADRRVQWRAAL